MSDTTTTIPAIEVQAPPFVARPFGLFSVAPAPTPERHALSGVWWQSSGCGVDVGVTEADCIGDLVDGVVEPLAPTVEQCDVSFAYPFTIYAFGPLSVGAMRGPDAQVSASAAARDHLLAGEQHAVEDGLWQALAAHVDTLGTAGSWLGGLAVLEAGLRDSYGGTGVIHIPTYAAVMLGDALQASGQRLLTRLGTPVVVGGGYASGTDWASEPDALDMYASGPLQIWSDDINQPETVVDRGSNEFSVLAYRSYVVGWDCVALGVTVTITEA